MKILDRYRPGSKRLQEDLSDRYSAQKPLIFLLRHGQIQGHETKRFIGGSTDIPLSDLGRAQAQYWQKEFAAIQFEAVYSSSLNRCTETAHIICPENDIKIDNRLNEIDMGSWDGKSFDEIKEIMPMEFERRGRQMEHFRPPGGESFQDLLDRVSPFFNGCLKKQSSQEFSRILVVTHAGVIRVMGSKFLGRDLKQLFEIKMGYGHLFIISNLKQTS